MNTFFLTYTLSWAFLCLIAIYLMIKNKNEFELFHQKYWKHLLQPWKIAIFIPAFLIMVLIAPYTIDITWDYIDASFMSILAFTTAPWSLGIIYRTIKYKESFKKLFVALVLWFFSVSWSYDIYIYFRDGIYPLTWLSNISMSSLLYLFAGMLWSLEIRENRGATFSFMEPEWFIEHKEKQFSKLFLYILPIVVIVLTSVLYFVK
jgi:hypothetical protein